MESKCPTCELIKTGGMFAEGECLEHPKKQEKSLVSPKERLYWYCQLVVKGYSGSEANRILDEAIQKLENDQKS